MGPNMMGQPYPHYAWPSMVNGRGQPFLSQTDDDWNPVPLGMMLTDSFGR